MVCLRTDCRVGIVSAITLNLGQAASPILTGCPVPASTPTSIFTPSPDHHTTSLPCPSLSFNLLPPNKKRRAESGPAGRSAGKAREHANASVKFEAARGPSSG